MYNILFSSYYVDFHWQQAQMEGVDASHQGSTSQHGKWFFIFLFFFSSSENVIYAISERPAGVDQRRE